MTVDAQGRRGTRTRVWAALSAVTVILALLIIPPYVSISRYKNRISQVLAASIGRPVRLSSVELRILPRPSFVLTDLVVEEDPAYGAEPVLHANTVTASIRLLPLWRGGLEISRISVDEASLNLVRTDAGHWNLDPFFRTAAAGAGTARTLREPKNHSTSVSRSHQFACEREERCGEASLFPGERPSFGLAGVTRGMAGAAAREPARTDVNLDLADTGVVRMEASLRRAPELRQMPVHIDLDWREAQLGQLSRLILGSDEGWRGDLTGEVHLDGTADAAQVKARLRASGVHRAEFAPASAMDFDASCGFVYHYSTRGLEKLLCDSPVGDGRTRLTGEMPGQGGEPQLSLELDRVPAQIGLDALRTLRRGLDPSLQATGTMSGQIRYKPAAASTGPAPPRATGRATRTGTNARTSKLHAPPAGPLSGAITLTGLRISADGLSKPIQAVKVTIQPADGAEPALTATAAIPAGAPLPLNITARLSLSDYQLGVHGPAALPRLREMARLAGIPNTSLLDNVNGQPALVDLSADGPWLPPPSPLAEAPMSPASAGSTARATKTSAVPATPVASGSDRMSGTVTLRTATWKADFLANPVEITAATLRVDNMGQRWDPVEFRYGPVWGTAMFQLPASCDPGQSCPPTFGIRFESLDSAALEAAILGARHSDTLLSNLLASLRPENAPGWPELEGTVHANELTLGPVTLSDAAASLRVGAAETEITALDANLLGGRIHATGSVTPGAKPIYKLEGSFTGLSAAGTGQLLGMTWAGNGLEGTGQIELSGFTAEDLGSSARGTLHFDWRHGSVSEGNEVEFPPVLTRFDLWTADAEVANGGITLKQNQVQRGVHKLAVAGSAVFGDPPKVSFGSSPEVRAKR